MLKRSISTGQLTTLIQTEVDALEGELDQQRKLAAEPNAPPPRANDLLNKSFEEVLRDQYSFIENDEDYAAQILGVADDGDRVEEGRQSVTPTKTAATKGHVEKTVQEAKETRKEREAVAELLRVLKAGEVLPGVGDNKAKEAKVEHSYFVGWLQKARIFCRLDRAVQQQPQASNDIFDDLLAAETLDYGKEALGYYQKCISLLPHLAGLTASDLKQAKVYLFSELGQYYQSKGMHRKALQVAVTLLSENRHSQEMQKMLRDSVTVLRETADANQAVFIISTISKLKSPIDACVDFISATYMQIEPLLQRSYDPMFIQARISIVNWYKLLLSEARVKRQCSKPLSVSLRLSSGIRNEGVKVVDHTQESLMMDLLLGYREHDQSPEVREAAKLAIEQVAEFTLDIIEEGYEHVQAGTEEAEGHVISIQVHMESLVQRCSYFQTMLSLNMVEKQTQRMRVVTSQPYVFLDMIDYLYHSEVEFESFDHALAVYMVANQYRVDELKELASSFLSTNAKSYAAEIEDDWAKFKEVYYLADAMNLPNLKTALTQHLTANARWLNNGATLPPFGTDMQRWREVECHFPEVFACVSNDGLIRKIQSAVKHDQLSIAEFFVDLLTKRKREPVPWHSATPFEPEAESQVESSAATVDAQGICSECRIMMGHLTTCSMFKNFRNIAGRARPTAPVAPPPPAVSGAASASQSTAMGGFVPESLLLSLLEKAHSVAWNDLMLKLLRSNFCAITPSVLVKPAEANDVVLLGQLLDILTAVYAEEDAETPGDADGDDDEVSKEKGKEKLRDREEVVPAKEESPRRREGKWQWEGDSSDWHDYDETANQLIEAAYSSGAVMITLTHGWFAGRCGFMIDLNRQKQRNNETNFERNIRRHELLPAAAAPLSHPQELKRQLAVLMNGPVHNGKTLLITFIEKRIPLSITKRFLDLGKSVIDVNVRASLESGESVTALALAIQSVAEARDEARNEPTADELVSRLLALGADPNLPFTVTSLLGMKPSTPLLQAIKQNNFELVQQLVSAGADVSFNVSTSRPLLSPIGADRGPVATLYSPEEDLLASLNSHADRNPLFASCFGREESEDSVRIVRLLLEKGAAGGPPDNQATPAAAGPQPTGSRSRTLVPPPPLVLPSAASSGSATSATTSQALDASVVRGNTPLMAAAFYGRADLVQLLLDFGSADQTAAAKAKKAKEKGKESDDDSSPRPQSACPSVPRACDANARNWWHWSPLHFAASAGHEEVVRLLCQAPGAIDSACVVSSNGIVNTARQMAADRQFNRVLSLICALPEDPVVPSLTSSQGSGGGESRSSGAFQHSAELAPLQTFTSVSALGGGATATAMSTLSGSATATAARPKRRLWDRLKFL